MLSNSMCYSFFQSDLSYYTYTEIALLLTAGILINNNKDWIIIPLTILATFNREGALFIPVMLFASRLSDANFRTLFTKKVVTYKFIWQSAFSVFGFCIVYFGLRHIIGHAAYSESRYGAVYPGLYLLYLNILNRQTWSGLGQIFNLLPLTIIFYCKWPALLQKYLWFLVIPWMMAGFVFGSADETRLFLVPLFIVFVPVLLNLTWHDNRLEITSANPSLMGTL